MTDAEDTRNGMAELVADALATGRPELELLLRYDRAPESLDAQQRERVEAYLSASPAHRDRLRAAVRLASRQEPGVAASHGAAEASRLAPVSRRRRSPRQTGLAAALAAMLFVAILYGLLVERSESEQEPRVRVAEEASEQAQDLAADNPRAEQPQSSPTSPFRPETQIAEVEGEGRAVPERVAQGPEAAAPEALQESELVVQSPTRPDAPEAVPAEPPAESMQLAMNLPTPMRYRTLPNRPLVPPMGPVRAPNRNLPSLQALAPSHSGVTLQPSPPLYWFLSEATDLPVRFVLRDRTSVDPALDVTLDAPHEAGIHALRLSEYGLELAPGVEYQWFLSLTPGDGPKLFAGGGIERLETPERLATQLAEAQRWELGTVYADGGVWYDALAFISSEIERAPEEPRLRGLRADLVSQVGLQEAAQYERQADP